MKVLSVVGARPQFVKLSPIAATLAQRDHHHVIVHTGQHYDRNMSDVFFTGLDIPPPDVNLEVGSGTHGRQTGAMLAAMDDVLERHRPDWVLVYGDTNSTVAGALSAAKMGLRVAHVEAGLRSFNRHMPEEHNRVLTDHAADLLLAPTTLAMSHLGREGLGARAVLVGDVMLDACRRVLIANRQQQPVLPPGVDPARPYLVATLHRAENTDEPSRLAALIGALAGLSMPVVLVAHPRLLQRAADAQIDLRSGAIRVIPPLPYVDMMAVIRRARAVVTDSGGLQKEAFLLGVPCTTPRSETEWPETLSAGWNVLAPTAGELRAIALREPPKTPHDSPFGDGLAADSIADALEGTHR